MTKTIVFDGLNPLNLDFKKEKKYEVITDGVMATLFEKYAKKNFDKSKADYHPSESWQEPVDGVVETVYTPAFYCQLFQADLPETITITKIDAQTFDVEIEYFTCIWNVFDNGETEFDKKEPNIPSTEHMEFETEQDLNDFLEYLTNLEWWL